MRKYSLWSWLCQIFFCIFHLLIYIYIGIFKVACAVSFLKGHHLRLSLYPKRKLLVFDWTLIVLFHPQQLVSRGKKYYPTWEKHLISWKVKMRCQLRKRWNHHQRGGSHQYSNGFTLKSSGYRYSSQCVDWRWDWDGEGKEPKDLTRVLTVVQNKEIYILWERVRLLKHSQHHLWNGGHEWEESWMPL